MPRINGKSTFSLFLSFDLKFFCFSNFVSFISVLYVACPYLSVADVVILCEEFHIVILSISWQLFHLKKDIK